MGPVIDLYKSENKENLKFYKSYYKKLPDNWDVEIETFLKEIAEEKKI